MQILNAPDAYHEISILLSDRVDAHALHQNYRKQNLPLQARTEDIITRLKAKARATQPEILNLLNQSSSVADGTIYPYWATNVIFATVKKDMIAQLSQMVAIEWMDKNYELELDSDGEAMAEESFTIPGFREPGLTAINAPPMWALGYTGYGRTAMSYDTGVWPDHPGFSDRYRGNFFPKEWSWFDMNDPTNTIPANCPESNPSASSDHGTHTVGTMLGLDRNTQDTFGVAFNALWMGVPGLCDDHNQASVTAYFQWAMNPDGDSSTIEDMPDVINNSWQIFGFSPSTECNGFFGPLFSAVEAAGIAIVFSAGNSGAQGTSSITAPKNINIDTVNVFSVANVNGNLSNLLVNNSSSRGPSICPKDSGGSLDIKPEVAAPGTSVRSAIRNGGYGNKTGTSMAAPHVSGAILLLKEAFPYLSGTELKLALYYTAVDLGAPGEDNDYGMGIIDVFAAYNYLVGKGNLPVNTSALPDIAVNRIELTDGALCGNFGAPMVEVENVGSTMITSLDIEYKYSDSTTGVFVWTDTIMPGQTKMIALPPQTFNIGIIDLDVNITAANGAEEYFYYNNKSEASFAVFEDNNLSVSDVDICSGANALIEGTTSDTNAVIVWYDSDEEGNSIAEGSQFLTPSINSDTVFYAGTVNKGKVGLEDNTAGPGIYVQTTSNYLEFDANVSFLLKSVLVYSNSNNLRIFEVFDKDGNQLYSWNAFVSLGENRVPLNFFIQKGEGYILKLKDGSVSDLFINISSDNYPYSYNGFVSITGSDNSGTFPFFYDWEIEMESPCPRVPVQITTSNGSVVADFSADQSLVDLGQNATVEFTDMSAGATSWLWDFGDGNTSTEQNPSNQYYFAGTYQVSLIASGPDSCEAAALMEIVVEGTYPYNVGVEDELTRLGNVVIYPNPGQGQYFIDFDLKSRTMMEIEVLDLSGKKVREISAREYLKDRVNLNLNDLSDGLYYVNFILGETSVVRKILKKN